MSRRVEFQGKVGLQNANWIGGELLVLAWGHQCTGTQRGNEAISGSPGKPGLQTAGPGYVSRAGLRGELHLLSSPCLCPPQATYVLLALAWVFVPIYISSEVSPLAALRAGLLVQMTCLPTHADRSLRTSAWGALPAGFYSPACCIWARKL